MEGTMRETADIFGLRNYSIFNDLFIYQIQNYNFRFEMTPCAFGDANNEQKED